MKTIIYILIIANIFVFTNKTYAIVDTVYATNIAYWTGSTTSSSKTQNSQVRAIDSEDGWMSFDISSIPTGYIIDSIVFHAYVDSTDYPYWSITPVSSNPLTASAFTLSTDISAEEDAGYYYHGDEISTFPTGWKSIRLNGNANSDFTSAISGGKFSVGICSRDNDPDYYIIFDGWNDTNPPYLEVFYSPNYMVYSSSTVVQDLSPVIKGLNNQRIIGIEVVTTGTSISPLVVSSITLNTNGTTSISDIENAKVFYTATSSTFNTMHKFGNTTVSPNGSFTVSGTDTLALGTNYFWLTFDIKSTATIGNLIDAQCTQISFSGIGNKIPSIINPQGSRLVSISNMVIIGTDTIINLSDGYPAPYGNFYSGAKHQILIRANEISSLGSSGFIHSLAFDVRYEQGSPLDSFKVKIGLTTDTSLTSLWLTGLTTVYSAVSYTDTIGWNTHTFNNPFYWDGVSNIIIETCFENSPNNYTSNAIFNQTYTTFPSVNVYVSDD